MGRYLLFAGDTYYPSGGWNDFVGHFSTAVAALAYLETVSTKYDWAHIVDSRNGSVVYTRKGG